MNRAVEPMTDKEAEACEALARLMQEHQISHGRGVFLFGKITERLISDAIEQGMPPEEAFKSYIGLFMGGIGAETVDPVELHAQRPITPSVRRFLLGLQWGAGITSALFMVWTASVGSWGWSIAWSVLLAVAAGFRIPNAVRAK